MCGICGIVDFAERAADAETLRAMVATLRHRGPDDEGIHLAGPAGLGQTRLSIVDLSPAGHQPMRSPDERHALVFNGEIYNYRQLRGELQTEGVRFVGNCDTEVVLHALIRWGDAALRRFDGMFAIAFWDATHRRMLLARDRFGIKPLYVYRLRDGVVFGSEIKALRASGRVERELNWQGLHEYLYFGNTLCPNTLTAGVEKLSPGHFLTVDARGVRQEQYWSIAQSPPVADDVPTATARVRGLLERAVSDHLIGDVPIGIFLSGGIDSSAITAFASAAYPGRIRTYSVGFDFDRGVNELPRARRIAERFGTDHQELHLAGGDMPGVLERLIEAHDEPFADAANIPLYLLCRELRGSVKVVLQGDGGDEIFGGYRRYNVVHHERFWRAAATAGRVFPRRARGGMVYDRLMRFFDAMDEDDPALRYGWLNTVETPSAPPERLLTAAARERLAHRDPFARYREVYAGVRGLDPLQRALFTDCQILLPDDFLEKVDRSTMASSVEVRVPMLDNNLTRYACGLPARMKVHQRQKKWILRRALRGVVPDDVLDAPKTGFGVPFAYWLRKPLAEYTRSVLLDGSFREWGLFEREALERLIGEHVGSVRNHGFMLYKLLNLALWRCAHVRSGQPTATGATN